MLTTLKFHSKRASSMDKKEEALHSKLSAISHRYEHWVLGLRVFVWILALINLQPFWLIPDFKGWYYWFKGLGFLYALATGLFPLKISLTPLQCQILCVLDSLFITGLVKVTGGIESPLIIVFFMPVIVISILGNLRASLGLVILTVLWLLYISSLEDWLRLFETAVQIRFLTFTSLFFAFALVLGLLRNETRRYAEALDLLAQAQRKVEEQNTLLKELSSQDHLTGIPNRRSLFSFAEKEMEQARRYNTPLSIIMVDVDGFKQLNDRYGHLVGDEVLKEVARYLRRGIRGADMVGRYGGDEFLVVLPMTDKASAQTVARRLQKGYQSHQGASGFSVGLATYPEDGQTFEALIQVADRAMYADKLRHKQKENQNS